MKESYLAECLEKFHELPDQLQELIGGFEACLKIKKIEEAYNVSLSFAVILVAIGELTIDDLVEYLYLKFKLDKEKGEKVVALLEEEIFSAALDLILENSSLEEDEEEFETETGLEKNKSELISDLSALEKKELILKTFSGEIVQVIYADPVKVQDFNIAIFQTFNEEDGLEDKVESLLYNNQEKLSEHHIILDGHPASPSIANWLKDFIKKYGSDIFNEVTLAEYLSQSPNIKQVKPEERELVRKVLKLYRNLVFFPESMDGIPLEKWEIFPVTRNESNEPEFSILSNRALFPEENVDPELTERQKIIFDLQKTLTKYPPNSLEYKAIHQEINRLSRK